MYQYKNGLVIGRFQCFHKGHEMIIRNALDLCERVYVIVGSAQESRTKRNPFTASERQGMIYRALKEYLVDGRLIVIPLADRENPSDDSSWGEYVMNAISSKGYELPEAVFEGNDPERQTWYETVGLKLHIADRNIIPISATALRDAILRDDKDFWYANKASGTKRKEYDFMREIILEVEGK